MAHITLGSPEPPPSSQHGCRRRRRLLIILASIISVAVAVAVSLAIYFAARLGPTGHVILAFTEAISRTFGPTLYPALCVSELAALPGAAAARDADLVPMSLDATRRRVAGALAGAWRALLAARAPPDDAAAAGGYDISDCLEMLEAAADLLNRSVSAVTASPAAGAAAADVHDDVMTWLSTALTYHDTCRDGLHEHVDGDGKDGRAVKAQMLGYLANLREHLSNSLAIFKAWAAPDGDVAIGVPVQKRQLLSAISGHGDLTFPAPRWVKHSDRQLLVAPTADIVPNMVVAKDGSGTHVSIGDAVEAALAHSTRRVVIYIKAGVYSENVKVARNKMNLMLVGDGAGQTVVVGHRSVRDSLRTFDTATMLVSGDWFMLRATGLSVSHPPDTDRFPVADDGPFWWFRRHLNLSVSQKPTAIPSAIERPTGYYM